MTRKKKGNAQSGEARKSIVKRNLGYFLGVIFNDVGDFPITIDEIRRGIDKKFEVLIQRPTLKKYNQRYFDEHEISPLCRIDDEHYVLNRYLFENKKFRKPRPRGYELKPDD